MRIPFVFEIANSAFMNLFDYRQCLFLKNLSQLIRCAHYVGLTNAECLDMEHLLLAAELYGFSQCVLPRNTRWQLMHESLS
jgi:hypothetical protein